jgi:hypothetical protein
MNIDQRIEAIWESYGAGELSLREAQAQVKQLIRDVVDEVIGENECPPGSRMIGVPSFQRDGLRKAQRAKRKELGL